MLRFDENFSIFQVVDVRINNKGVTQSRNLPESSQKSVPNFGFVVFEDEKAANACLTHKPINLPNGHRLNVETKKKNVMVFKNKFGPYQPYQNYYQKYWRKEEIEK